MGKLVTTKAMHRGRGLHWSVYVGDRLAGGVSSTYLSSSSGEAFAPAYGPGTVIVTVKACAEVDGHADIVLADVHAKVRGRAAADKWARAWIREQDAFGMIERHTAARQLAA